MAALEATFHGDACALHRQHSAHASLTNPSQHQRAVRAPGKRRSRSMGRGAYICGSAIRRGESPSEPYTLILTKFTEPGRNLRAARVAACGSRCSTPKC
eukprot:scaffold92523_cov75-Phaeocystis_antarctica.AAC.2